MEKYDNELVFYGTGGADGIPNPFCRCALCEHARVADGKDRRRRSMLRISEQICIDLGPDAAGAAAAFGDLHGLRHVLVTHTHEDHFYYALAETRALAAAPQQQAEPLEICLTGAAYEIVAEYHKSPAFLGGKMEKYQDAGAAAFRKLSFGREEAVGGVRVLPLKGNHRGNMGERAANYLLALPDGRSLYYAVDTGYYLDETFDALAGRGIDILVSECTWGRAENRGERPDKHLDFASALGVFRRLLESGAITRQTQIYLTHINHTQGAGHAALEQMAAAADFPCKIVPAWDGCRIGA